MFENQNQFIESLGINVAFSIRVGKKAENTIVFLHGWGGSKESFFELWKKTDDKDTLLSIDLEGFGKTDIPKKPLTLTDYADFVEKFLIEISDALKLPKTYYVVVHSFGGRIFFKYIQKIRKIKFSKAVLIAAAGIKHSDSLKIKLIKILASFLKPFKKIAEHLKIFVLFRKFAYKLAGTNDYEKLTGTMKKTFLNVVNEDLKDSISLVTVPTLIFWGKYDSYVPVKDAYFMKQTIKDSKLKIFEDGKHGIHKTHASQIADEINIFIKQK